MNELRVATLNVRNTADRWRRRLPLLVRQLVELDPHVMGLQELRSTPDQAATIRRAAARRTAGRLRYEVHRTYKTGLWGFWEGIGTFTTLPIVDRGSLAVGGQSRVAQRVTVRLPAGGVVEVYNTHLASGDEALRTAQAGRILEWMRAQPPAPQVLVGDLNAGPGSPPVELLRGHLRSAYAAVHGREPSRTVPTPLRAGATGPGHVLDHILVTEHLEVHDARVVFDQSDPDDEHLAASDHYGLVATVSVRPGGRPARPSPRSDR
ncbi:MAG: endonuclease/exonuclease/phosphatase family protein [Actinomycetota bacterium]|nr:endonuclease/exonuclease/phosphatase family protein [Actinomycetota bacterium]